MEMPSLRIRMTRNVWLLFLFWWPERAARLKWSQLMSARLFPMTSRTHLWSPKFSRNEIQIRGLMLLITPLVYSRTFDLAWRYWQFDCQTMEDIYESIRGKPASRGTKAAKSAQEEERAPELDEMWFFSPAFSNLDLIHGQLGVRMCF